MGQDDLSVNMTLSVEWFDMQWFLNKVEYHKNKKWHDMINKFYRNNLVKNVGFFFNQVSI